MVDGLSKVFNPSDQTVIVNVGDDFEHYGLRICPDLDTVCYTLAGLVNPETGWGRAQDTWEAIGMSAQLGGPTWFRLGDRDLGIHMERTRLLKEGFSLSQVTIRFCRALNIEVKVIPATDQPVPTWVQTADGELPFQEYFVRLRCEPAVQGFRLAGVETAQPAPGVLDALEAAEWIVICPSNPWVSIDPILSLPGVRMAIESCARRGGRVLAVSPIIAGQTVKGPAAKMFRELGISPSALAVAAHYRGLITDFVLDHADSNQVGEISSLGIHPWVTDVLMKNVNDRKRFALEIVSFLERSVV
jgi:LPPG:FO 2-phospho-L-lactate transferase